jgi:hypothetical protein
MLSVEIVHVNLTWVLAIATAAKFPGVVGG